VVLYHTFTYIALCSPLSKLHVCASALQFRLYATCTTYTSYTTGIVMDSQIHELNLSHASECYSSFSCNYALSSSIVSPGSIGRLIFVIPRPIERWIGAHVKVPTTNTCVQKAPQIPPTATSNQRGHHWLATTAQQRLLDLVLLPLIGSSPYGIRTVTCWRQSQQNQTCPAWHTR
jgi:hypothetical protein